MTKKTKHPGIYETRDGRYRVLATVRQAETGRRLRKELVLPEHATLEEALLVRSQLVLELKGVPTNLPSRVRTRRPARLVTLADYAEGWLKRRSARLKPSVQELYLKTLADRILPVLGDRFLPDIRRADVEEWVIWA